jgi:hypothetical protein
MAAALLWLATMGLVIAVGFALYGIYWLAGIVVARFERLAPQRPCEFRDHYEDIRAEWETPRRR